MNEAYRLYFRQVYRIACNSTNPIDKNAAGIGFEHQGEILGGASNTIPDYQEWMSAPQYLRYLSEHPEVNTINKFRMSSLPTEGTILFVPWGSSPRSAKYIADAGITKVVYHTNALNKVPTKSRKSCQVGIDLLGKFGIEVEYYEGKVFSHDEIEVKIRGRSFFP